MYGYELDLIQQKLNEGHIVKILHCDGSASFCSANNSKIMSYKKIKLVCSYCKSKFHNGLNWLDNKKNLIIESFDLLNASQKKTVFEFEKLLEEKNKLDKEILSFLNNIHHQLENICTTTLITETNSIKINYDEKATFNLFKKVAKSSIEAHYSALNQLEKFNADELYIFNGRLYRYQPFLRLAQSRIKSENINVYEFPLYEYNNMYITKKNYPQDLKNLSDHLFQFNQTENVNFLEKEKIAEKWIEDRINKTSHEKYFYPWKNKQITGLLPANFNKLNTSFTINFLIYSIKISITLTNIECYLIFWHTLSNCYMSCPRLAVFIK